MDALDIAFDRNAVLTALERWACCESPTWDATAVGRMLALAAGELRAMGASVEEIPGAQGFGGCLRARMQPERTEPGVLLMGHVDTVHPIGTLEALPFRIEGDKAFGPGIQDMKGGIVLALEALRQLARAGVATARPVTVLLTPDEEVGSPSTRALIEAEAARHAAVLIPEPAQSDGGVTTGRYAIARFDLKATGRPSHAGARLADGRSAIGEMARQILAIEAMTTPDCTFSVGVVHGGAWVNCVSTECRGEALSMAKRQHDLDHGVARMLALTRQDDGIGFEVTRGVTRPVWEPNPGTMTLYAHAHAIAASLGFDLPHASSGGGSDGNFTGALGIPTLDGLGVEGAGLHTLGEHIAISALERRFRLLAGLLASV